MGFIHRLHAPASASGTTLALLARASVVVGGAGDFTDLKKPNLRIGLDLLPLKTEEPKLYNKVHHPL
jgi:hypothetical protein